MPMGWHYNSFLEGKQWPFISWHAFTGREIQIACLFVKLFASCYCWFPHPSFFLLSQCDKSRRVSTDIFWAGPAWPLPVVTVVAESLWDVLWFVLHSYVSALKWTEFRLLFFLLIFSLRVANLIRKLSNSESMSVLFIANSHFGRSFLTDAVCAFSSPSFMNITFHRLCGHGRSYSPKCYIYTSLSEQSQILVSTACSAFPPSSDAFLTVSGGGL